MQRIANYIGGELVPPVSGRYPENIEPATGRSFSEVPDSDSADVDRAVAAAKKAFPAWAETSLEERSIRLRRIANLIEAKTDVLTRSESADAGKPLSAARQVDIPRAAANFQFFRSAIRHFFSESHAAGSQALNYSIFRTKRKFL